MSRWWKTTEIKIIRNGLENEMNATQIAEHLPGRTIGAVRIKINQVQQQYGAGAHLTERKVRDWLFGSPHEPNDAANESIAQIVDRVAERACISPAAIYGSSRLRCHVRARHAAMYLAWRDLRKSTPKIGMAFGNRDHTTVLHAIRAVEARPHLYPIGDRE